MKPKVLILRTAGTNCDYETDHAFQLVGGETSLIHVNQLIAGEVDLMDYQIMAIPGGFSYGDDVAAGILLANEMRYKLADPLAAYVESGRLMIGICNGFQVLVRAGLLPRLDSQQAQQTTLAMNTSAKFECRWVELETQQSSCSCSLAFSEKDIPQCLLIKNSTSTYSNDIVSTVKANV